MLKRVLFAIAAIVVIIFVIAIAAGHVHAPAGTTKPKTTTQTTTATFNKQAHSTTDPTSVWVVVNKQHPIQPIDYAPADLVVPDIPLRSNITADEKQVSAVMAPALEAMATAAKADGLTLVLLSGYRSYAFQVNLYNSYVKQDGQAQADQESARPGHSEHQTGFAADLGGTSNPSCNLEICFENTTEGEWLAANAYKYGFIIRYTAAEEAVTGYEAEPWHVRYIGTDLSMEMHREDITTLEQFFGISGGVNY